MADLLVVRSKIKEYAKVGGKQMNISSDLADALSEKVKGMIEKAAWRSNENKRSTVQAKDL